MYQILDKILKIRRNRLRENEVKNVIIAAKKIIKKCSMQQTLQEITSNVKGDA